MSYQGAHTFTVELLGNPFRARTVRILLKNSQHNRGADGVQIPQQVILSDEGFRKGDTLLVRKRDGSTVRKKFVAAGTSTGAGPLVKFDASLQAIRDTQSAGLRRGLF